MRRISVFMLLLVLLGVTPVTSQAEAGKASLTIHYRWCPYGYVHQEYAALCHDNPLASNTMGVMSGAGYIIEKTDGDGNLTLSLDPNTYEIFIGIAADFSLDEYRFCTPTDQPNVEIHGPLILSGGDDVTCDYYYVGGGGRSSLPSDDSLPSGAGHIHFFHALVCKNDPGVVSELLQPFPPSGCTTPRGIKLTVAAGDGTPIGTCTTEDGGYCAMHVFFNVVIVSEDTSTIPDGYAPRANFVLQYLQAGNESIVNVPIGVLPTAAPADSSITVHGRVCPDGYAGTDYFKDCHDNLPDYPQMIFLRGNMYEGDYLAKTIDSQGNVTFSELVPEFYLLFLGLPPDNLDAVVQCSHADALGSVMDLHAVSSLGWSFTAIDLGPGEDIVCDAYTIPPAA